MQRATCLIDHRGEQLHCGKPISEYNKTLLMEEPRPTLAPCPTSEPLSQALFRPPCLPCAMPQKVGQRSQTDSVGGEKGRGGGTSEAKPRL